MYKDNNIDDLTCVFPLLEFTVQEAQAYASRAGQGQCGQDRVYPHVVYDNFVVHETAVHVDGAVRAIALLHADDVRRDVRCHVGRDRCRERA